MENVENIIINNNFGKLFKYGHAISWLGWFIFSMGIIVFTYTIFCILQYTFSLKDVKLFLAPSFIGFSFLLWGILLVVFGKLIICIVSIEGNTNKALAILNKMEKVMCD